jgi:hypothetical protein
MSPLLAKMVAMIFWKAGWQVAKAAHQAWMEHYGEQYNALSDEERKAWNDGGWVQDFTPGEGRLPETAGIVLKDSLDPSVHKDDKVGE